MSLTIMTTLVVAASETYKVSAKSLVFKQGCFG